MNKILQTFIGFSLILTGMASAHANATGELIKQGRISLSAGYYRQAKAQFQQAYQQAQDQQDTYHLALSQGLLGNLAMQKQQFERAEQLLADAARTIKGDAWPKLQAQLSIFQGKLQLRQGLFKAAQKAFQQALVYAQQNQSPLLSVSANINLATLAHQQKQSLIAWQHLKSAQALLAATPNQPESHYLWLDLGYQTQQITRHQQTPEQLELAYSALNTALQQAQQRQQNQTQILALNYLADLYEAQGNNAQALELTLTAIDLTQQLDQHALMIDLDWRLGRIFNQQNQLSKATAAYRRAVDHIEAIRIDMLITYKGGRSSFRETLSPVYAGLADVLLKRAQQAPLAQKQAILTEARDTIETFKRRELQDYFQNHCELPDWPIILDQRLPKTAALYPILLPDRLEVIIYSAQGLQQFSTPVTASKLTQTTQHYASLLRSYGDERQLQKLSSQLYDWIVRTPLPTI